MPVTIIDVIENFYEDDLKSVCARFQDAVDRGFSIDHPDLRVKDLVDVHRETWANLWPASEDAFPVLQVGEVRPLVVPSLTLDSSLATGSPAHHLSWMMPCDPWDSDHLLMAVKRYLLYSHSVVIMDKLQNVGLYRSSLTGSLGSLTNWLVLLDYCHDLIVNGIVYVSPFVSATAMYADVVLSRTPLFAGTTDPRPMAQDRIDDHILEINRCHWRDSGQGLFWSPERCSLVLTKDSQSHVLEIIRKNFQHEPRFSEALANVVTDPLGSWFVPDLVSLDTTHIKALREDNAFGEFRSTVRSALQIVAEQELEADKHVAFSEHMGAAASALERQTKSGTLGRLVVDRGLTWSAGALVGGALADWPGAAAGLATQAFMDSWRNRRRRRSSVSALAQHYVALSSAPKRQE